MNDIAKQIADGTKTIVEESGKKYVEPDFDEPAADPSDEEIQQFIDQVVSQINDCTELKKKEQAEYRRMFGGDPNGNTSGSYSISN